MAIAGWEKGSVRWLNAPLLCIIEYSTIFQQISLLIGHSELFSQSMPSLVKVEYINFDGTKKWFEAFKSHLAYPFPILMQFKSYFWVLKIVGFD